MFKKEENEKDMGLVLSNSTWKSYENETICDLIRQPDSDQMQKSKGADYNGWNISTALRQTESQKRLKQ